MDKSWISIGFWLLAMAGILGLTLIPENGNSVRAQEPDNNLPNDAHWMAIGSGDLNQPTASILVYVPQSETTLDLSFVDFCDTNPAIDLDPDNVGGDGDTGRATTAAVANSSVGPVGTFSCGSPSITVDMTPAIFTTRTIKNAFGVDVIYNVVNVIVSMQPGAITEDYLNSFRLGSSTSGVVIGPSNAGFSAFASAGVGDWSTEMDFAQPCGAGAQTVSVDFLDSDAHSGGYQDGSPITWRIQSASRGSASFADLPPPSGGVLNGGDGEIESISFTASDDQIYRLVLEGINEQNAVQVRLPFEQINSLDNCVAVLAALAAVSPYAVVEGGGIVAGGNVFGRGDGTQGSRVDHGLIANGVITQFGSNGSNGSSELTFANPGAGVQGNFGFSGLSNNRAAGVFNTLTATDVAGGVGDQPPNINLPSPSNAANAKIFKYDAFALGRPGLHITTDNVLNNYAISNQDSIKSLVVMVRGDIYINRNVTNLHGIYIATGDIITCADNAGIIPAPSLCQNKLDIRGSLIADGNVVLARLSGGIGSAGDTGPSETIINAPEMSIPGIGNPVSGSREDVIRELPIILTP